MKEANPGSQPPQSAGTNRLIREKSPYLLQHAHNPVDWYAWGDEAFDRAVQKDLPVFLSIGYATCHWCHVMAHESFENPEIALLMNRSFVCIKVDREERPDIDSMYMAACQLMTGQGGWPLSVFLTPDRKPFYAGTYFPPRSRSGIPGFSDILEKITSLWNEDRELLISSARNALDALASLEGPQPGSAVDPALIRTGFDSLAAAYDPVNGGFGRAPKFPSPPVLLFLLRYYKRTGEEHALAMAERTLLAMARGGIYDHIGGGFHRYSVDERWQVPHFEKMLYDQALLLQVYTEVFLLSGDQRYRRIAEGVAEYILSALRDPCGAFITAVDADSPGGEGAYYLWTWDGIAAAVGDEDARAAREIFTLVPFSDPHGTNRDPGRGVISRAGNDLPGREDSTALSESIRTRLQAARATRDPPFRDTKILADINGLCIAALAIAYRALGDARYLLAAHEAMGHVLGRMRMPDGGLFHRYRDGEAAIPGFADDYAFTVRALLELFRTDFNREWLDTAAGLQQYFSDHFRDDTDGAYFSSADNADRLLIRKKEFYDGVVPSANSVSLENLAVLALLTDTPVYGDQSGLLARTCAGVASRSPSAYTWSLSVLDLQVYSPTVVTISSIVRTAVGTNPLVLGLWKRYLPSVFLVADESGTAPAGNAAIQARVCTGQRCSLPVGSLQEVLGLLGETVPDVRGGKPDIAHDDR